MRSSFVLLAALAFLACCCGDTEYGNNTDVMQTPRPVVSEGDQPTAGATPPLLEKEDAPRNLCRHDTHERG